MITTLTLIRYINVGRLLHFIALLDLIISAVAVYYIVTLNAVQNTGLITICVVVVVLFGGMSVYAELDGYSRFQDYKRVKDQLYFYGYQERIIRPMLKSRCQRDAAQLACDELGVGEQSKTHFNSHGYKWYHIIPDFVWADPGFFFKAYFWRGTFFTPYYKSRVDFSLLDPSELNLSIKNLQVESVA